MARYGKLPDMFPGRVGAVVQETYCETVFQVGGGRVAGWPGGGWVAGWPGGQVVAGWPGGDRVVAVWLGGGRVVAGWLVDLFPA